MFVHITDMDTFDYVEDVHVNFNWETHEYVGKETNIRYGIGSMYLAKDEINGVDKKVWVNGGILDEFFDDGDSTEVNDSIFSELIFGCALNRLGLKLAN